MILTAEDSSKAANRVLNKLRMQNTGKTGNTMQELEEVLEIIKKVVE